VNPIDRLTDSQASLDRDSLGDLQWSKLDTGSSKFLHLTGHCNRGSGCQSMCCGLNDLLQREDARPLFHDELCSLSCVPKWEKSIRHGVADTTWPVTWLEGHNSPAGLANGFQVWAVAGCQLEPVEYRGRVVGHRFEDDEATYLAISDLRPSQPSLSRPEQAREVFDAMIEVLDTAGMNFSQVVRTWLYLDHILEWYDDFNVVRNAFFEEYGVFDQLVPASTGIGCAHPANTAMVAKLLAVVPKVGRVTEVKSPLQCPATKYRSAFSRAVEVALPSHRQLYISGTASIEPGGETIHVDDTRAQIDLTMKVVHAILETRGMDWSDTTRAIAYLRDNDARPLLADWLQRHQLTNLPLVTVQSDVCRDDLLYEIELDATKLT
jgi:enamine deaminase RidA (YjgF/YER057c/UK114 family)